MTPHQLARTVKAWARERLYLLPFGVEMANFTDREFARDVLAAGLGVRHVAVGFDITFGKGRTRRSGGDAPIRRGVRLHRLGRADPSRTAWRQDLLHRRSARLCTRAQPEIAARLLGRPFAIEGIVQKGRQLGRKLGFPTANVPLGDYVAPKFGVYATRTRLHDGR